MKSYGKTILRSVKANLGRLLSICFIILLGITFVSGLGTLTRVIKTSFARSLKDNQVPDIIIKSEAGFSAEEIEFIKNHKSVARAQELTMIDLSSIGSFVEHNGQNLNTRIYILPLGGMALNKINIIDGKAPGQAGEILIERSSDTIKHFDIGEKFSVFGNELEVVGIAQNPMMISKNGDVDFIDMRPLDLIIYVDTNFASELLSNFDLIDTIPVTDIYILSYHANKHEPFTKGYKKSVQSAVEELKSDLKSFNDEMGYERTYHFLTLNENKSTAILEFYCDRVDIICAIFPLFFIAVAALVVLTTMSRMIEEERPLLGCFKTLGYTDGQIVFKYVFLVFICCLIASIAGSLAGVWILPTVIYNAFAQLFYNPEMVKSFSYLGGILASLAMFITVEAVTLSVCLKELKGQPAEILRPKAPKAGKKIALEKVRFFWNRLPFRYKSTFRNMFRYVNHYVMTAVSVAGSTALVFAGFALLDMTKNPAQNVGNLASAFYMISLVIILFALLLTAFVVYNLTNMNIGERKREIATLKVLGYLDNEVTGYIYREIFLMALTGIIIGIPLGCLLVHFVFNFIDFGSLSYVRWYSYLITPALVMIFIGIVDLILKPKIDAISMTSSLSSIE